MRRVDNSEISYMQFEGLADHLSLRHGVSLRGSGESNFSGADSELSKRSRDRFCQALGLPQSHLARCRQVHSNRVAVITGPGRIAADTDGMITNVRQIPLLLLGADCPLLIAYDPVRQVLGVCHAGWRGTVQKIACHMIQIMRDMYKSETGDIFAGIGPCICGTCYEVGQDVVDQAEENLRHTREFIREKDSLPARKWQFDLAAAIRLQLMEAGLHRRNIEESGCCTYEQPELFYSYRREGQAAGRWALLAGLV